MAQLEVHVRQVGAATAEGTARHHTVIIDRPVTKGGTDRGPLGGEYFLLGLGGCYMSNLLAAVRAREADVADVQIALTATIDGTPERFTAIQMKVTAAYKDAELMKKLISIAGHACFVSNTLRNALDLSVSLESPPVTT